MLGFDHHRHAARVYRGFHCRCDLPGQAFLNLQNLLETIAAWAKTVAQALGTIHAPSGSIGSSTSQKPLSQAQLEAVHLYATGGVVPGGFQNDTYPALLTSGETVVPAGASAGMSSNQFSQLIAAVNGLRQDIQSMPRQLRDYNMQTGLRGT